jgi:O-antigen ligase
MSAMTNLRLAVFPVGVAEILLAVWALSLVPFSLQRDLWRPLLGCWAIFFAALIAGFALSAEGPINPGAHHNFLASIYCAGFSVLLVIALQRLKPERLTALLLQLALASVLIYTIAIVILMGPKTDLAQMMLMTTYYPGRLAAWSSNPNQLSLFFTGLPALILYGLASSPFSTRQRVGLFAALTGLFLLGLTQRSDALLLSWLAALTLLLVLSPFKAFGLKTRPLLLALALLVSCWAGYRTVMTVEASNSPIQAAERLHINLKPLIVLEEVHPSAIAVGLDPNKGSSRLTLWENGLQSWLEAPLFGHGPGVFSSLPAYSFPIEAHNLAIDLLTQAGLIGTLPWLVLAGWIAWQAIRQRQAWALALLVAIGVFSLAHYTFRMPIFWFYLLLAASLVRQNKPCAA